MRKIIFALAGLTASLVMAAGDMGKCQANCGIDAAKCLILRMDPFACGQEEAACALECLKQVTVKESYTPKVKTGDIGKCEANCGIDAGKCLILKLDPFTCG